MSMDEIYEQLVRLHQGLESFNEGLRQSITDVNQRHEKVDPFWQDSLRREYDSRWEPLKESMDAYVERTGPLYVEAIQQKLQQIIQYLNGNEY